jgi:competence protein ComEC
MGDTGAIPQNVMRDYRESGIAHMLSISGLHMSLFAGLAFLVMRRGLALIPALALRHPIKKWAAAFALVLTTLYLLLSGGSVPTQRAWMMTTIALTAIMLDRSPFSLRLVGIAALVVAIRDPESVVGPSFQMSFGAVVALISTYQLAALRFGLFGWPGWLRIPVVALGGTLASTAIATVATAPFALYHFGRIAVHSLPANLLGVPPLGLWVMPWGVISILAMPFGLEEFPLRCMAWGIGWIDGVAARVSSWPGHLLEAAQMPDFGLALCAAGGLWLCLGFGRTRALALVAVIAGIASPWMRPPPDVLIADRGAAIAVREAKVYGFLGGGRTAFLRAVWRGQTGLPMTPGVGWKCDAEGCAATVPRGWTIARSTASATLGDDCGEAVVVVARFPVPGAARAACGATLFDAEDLERSGALALWLDEDGRIARLDSVFLRQGRRPWGVSRGETEDGDDGQ